MISHCSIFLVVFIDYNSVILIIIIAMIITIMNIIYCPY